MPDRPICYRKTKQVLESLLCLSLIKSHLKLLAATLGLKLTISDQFVFRPDGLCRKDELFNQRRGVKGTRGHAKKLLSSWYRWVVNRLYVNPVLS
jgi:hypothetical protein